jgi:hypothetical protein
MSADERDVRLYAPLSLPPIRVCATMKKRWLAKALQVSEERVCTASLGEACD